MSVYDPPEPDWMDDEPEFDDPDLDEPLRCIDCDSRYHRFCDKD